MLLGGLRIEECDQTVSTKQIMGASPIIDLENLILNNL
jgi:hypothetical protein